MTCEVCRDVASGASGARAQAGTPRCTPAFRLTGHTGPSIAVDRLPPDLVAEGAHGAVIAYRIRLLNSSGRSAGVSAAVLIPAGPPVEGVSGFRAVQTRSGVVLEWRREGEGKVEVVRTLAGGVAVDQAAARATPRKGMLPGRSAGPSTLVRLEGGGAEPGGQAAGILDASAAPGTGYIYQAERIRPMRVGGETVMVRSEPTLPIEVGMRETFPPMPPTGLVTVPGLRDLGGGKMAATLDLSWQPNSEADLEGYQVYRTDLGPARPEKTPRRLTAKPVQGPAYRDMEILAGERYEYRITAVDHSGNESRPGDPEEDSIPQLP